MLSLLRSAEVFLVTGATDLRKAFNGLPAIVRNVVKKNPVSGQAFVFCNRRRNRLKILFWDRNGYWICAKRLEQGTFTWPDVSATSVEMTPEELAMLLGGLDFSQTKQRRWYTHAANE